MDIELKPCPFCGHSAHIERIGDRGQSTIYQCDFCSCSLETGEEWEHGRQWNRRSEAVALRQQVEEMKALYETQIERAENRWKQWEARAEAAEAALKEAVEIVGPMADAVYNDNGDMTVTIPHLTAEQCIKAYFARRAVFAWLAKQEAA